MDGLAGALGLAGDAGQRDTQVALDVDRQRLERRDVEHPTAFGRRGDRPEHQAVQASQEGCQRFPGAGRRQDQGVLTGGDPGPAVDLGRGRRGEGSAEPATGGGVEGG